MLRLEDRGVTLRLFRHAAKAIAQALTPVAYGFGFVAKDETGQWVDAWGPLPQDWSPTRALLEAQADFADSRITN